MSALGAFPAALLWLPFLCSSSIDLPRRPTARLPALSSLQLALGAPSMCLSPSLVTSRLIADLGRRLVRTLLVGGVLSAARLFRLTGPPCSRRAPILTALALVSRLLGRLALLLAPLSLLAVVAERPFVLWLSLRLLLRRVLDVAPAFSRHLVSLTLSLLRLLSVVGVVCHGGVRDRGS